MHIKIVSFTLIIIIAIILSLLIKPQIIHVSYTLTSSLHCKYYFSKDESNNLIFLLAGPRPLYYGGTVDFIRKTNGTLVHTGYYVFPSNISVDIFPETDGIMVAKVIIEGRLHFNPSLGACKGASIDELFKSCGGVQPNATLVNGNYTLILRFYVNTTNGYASYGRGVLGLFPFYIFPDITYDNATDVRFVYLGQELKLDTLNGKPIPVRYVFESPLVSNRDYLICLRYYNKYIELLIVHHYPVVVRGLIPVNTTHYLYVDLTLSDRLLPYVLSVDDYPEYASYIDYGRLAILVGTAIAVALAVYMFVRWWKRGWQ